MPRVSQRAENENTSPCLGIHSEISGKRGRQDKKAVAWELMGDHCIQEVLDRFMKLMACEVTLEGFSIGDKEENTVVETNGGLESNTGRGRKSIC